MNPSLQELESVCQKPRWREVGSWLARRVARPGALRLTWLIVRWPISANAVTAITLVIGVTAAVLFGFGPPSLFIAGAAVLNLWYLLDHVDGQVARFHRRESVTGVYFDFMMHHVVHAAVAFSLGFGLARQTGELAWTLAGAALALGLSALSLANDCRYKAFFAEIGRERKRLQIANCKLKIANCLVQRAGLESAKNPARHARFVWWVVRPIRLLHRGALKLCEMPNVVIALTLLAAVVVLGGSYGSRCVQLYVLALAVLAPALAIVRLTKQVWLREPDTDFQDILRMTAAEQPAGQLPNDHDRPQN